MDKLNETNFPQQKHMTKKDYVIICGDFGDIWSAKSNEQKDMLQWLSQRNFTTLFLDGNWENYGKLNSQTITVWNGGNAHRLTDSVIHLMRGQIFEIDGRSFFTMGGATSHDRQFRKEGRSWWPEELPSEEELARAGAALDGCGRRVDYVLTHCAPTLVQGRINPTFLPDRLTEYLQHMRDTTAFHRWYFGHYHVDREYDDGFCALYDCVVPIE